MDLIVLRGIRAYGKHGADPGERDHEQPFDIDVHIETDLSSAGSSDDLADTVNYARVHAQVLTVVRERSYALLERLAAEILQAIFQDARIVRARIEIAKPNLLGGATPSIVLERSNPRRT